MRTIKQLWAIVCLAMAFCATAHAQGADLTPYLSPPRAQATSVPGPTTENFDAFATGTLASGATGNLALGTYSVAGAPAIHDAEVWGGAGGTGKYLVVWSGSSFTVTLTQPSQYVGLWWSAGDGGNIVDVLDTQGQLLGTFTTANLTAFLGGAGSVSALNGSQYPKADYYGNPNAAFAGNPGEPYAYVHLVLSNTPRRIGQLVFRGTNFEVDNLSVTSTSVTPDPHWVPLTALALASATNDSFSTPVGTTINASVATNDTGAPAGSTFSPLTGPAHGTLTLGANGSFSYTPAAGYVGTDTFTYRVCLPAPNATQCAVAQVTISIGIGISAVPTLSAAPLAAMGVLLALGAALRGRRRGLADRV